MSHLDGQERLLFQSLEELAQYEIDKIYEVFVWLLSG